jgi:hypothetical protein
VLVYIATCVLQNKPYDISGDAIQGIHVKKILNTMTIQESDVVWLHQTEEFIGVKQISKGYLGQILLADCSCNGDGLR